MNKVFVQRISLLVIAGLLGLGQLQKFDSIPIFLHEIMMLCVVLLSFIDIVKRIQTIKNNAIFQSCVVFVLYLFASTLLQLIWSPASVISIGLLYSARLVLYGLFALSVFIMLKQKLLKLAELEKLVIFTTSIIVVVGLLQFFYLPDLRILRFSGWDDHYLRLTSTLLDPSFTGIVLFLGSVTFISKLLITYSHTHFALFIFTVTSLFFTYSRGTYLACLSWLIVLLVYIPSVRKIMLWMIIAGGMIILLLPRPASEGARLERITSIKARIVNTTSTLQSMSAKDWVVGKGWYVALANREPNNSLTTISHSSSPDNSFLHVLQSLGIIGLGMFLWILQAVWKKITIQGKAILIAVSVASLFSQILFYPFVMILFPYTLFLNRKS